MQIRTATTELRHFQPMDLEVVYQIGCQKKDCDAAKYDGFSISTRSTVVSNNVDE